MKITPTRLKDVLIIEPHLFGDQRGYFMETLQKRRYAEAGIDIDFLQDNVSFSQKHILRGLHFQHSAGQAKLVQVLEGAIFEVAVDVRCGSPDFGQSAAVVLSAGNHRQLFIPQGFAHGFCVLSKTALFMHKCSDFSAPQHEAGVCWDDPDLSIDCPVPHPVLSERDRSLPRLKQSPADRLPPYGG